uniref:Uncharacterized protein n=1 Tax=Anguilla anguilla TaxID=7936 RepID=A0A0E9RGD2_ANGAN
MEHSCETTPHSSLFTFTMAGRDGCCCICIMYSFCAWPIRTFSNEQIPKYPATVWHLQASHLKSECILCPEVPFIFVRGRSSKPGCLSGIVKFSTFVLALGTWVKQVHSCCAS